VVCVLGLFPGAAPSYGAPTLPPDFQDRLIATVASPTAQAFIPDGTMLVTTQPGTLRVYRAGSLLTTPALDLTSRVCSDSERGFLGVAVDPSFATNHFIYLYYTFKKFGVCDQNSATSPVNRVSRFTLSASSVVDLTSERVLIDNIPSPNGNHNGGDLRFGNDRYLYVGVGDGGCDYAGDSGCGASNNASRDQNVLLGKILRVTREGGIPTTNPFQGVDSARCNVAGRTDPGKKCQETFAWGLRNPFRLSFDRRAGSTRFYINDVGEVTWEEIDLGQAGADYGWNVREGPCVTQSITDCGPPPAGMTNPIYSYQHSSGCDAITAGAFIPNGVWPRTYDNGYLYGDLVCGKLFKLSSTNGVFTATEFASGLGAWSITSGVFGPYGGTKAFYYLTYANGGEVHRISYEGYSTPQSAPAINVSLVPGFKECSESAANAKHAAPFAVGSCSPPESPSGASLGPLSRGFATLSVIAGDPGTTANEANAVFGANLTDVRVGSPTGADYNPLAGPDMLLGLRLRTTDHGNCVPACAGSFTNAGTLVDVRFSVPIACSSTADTTLGAACSVNTTANSILPGMIGEGRRTVLDAFAVRLEDAGLDSVLGTPDDNPVAQQGIFIP
jgi:glucose/arabinose dehydrogenase